MIVRKLRNSVTIPYDLAVSTDLDISAKGLLTFILAVQEPEHLTVEGIAISLRETRAAVRQAAIQLEAFGYIEGLVE